MKKYTCEVCNKQTSQDNFYAVIRRSGAEMAIGHGKCIPEAGGDYDIPLRDFDCPDERADWLRHLRGKNWIFRSLISRLEDLTS